MDIEKLIEEVENDPTREMLIDPENGELWAVDASALRYRGYPDGGWMLLADISKAVLVKMIYHYRGLNNIDNDTSER